MTSVAYSISLEAVELEQKRLELSSLERELAEKELQLSTVRGETHYVERLFQHVVEPRYRELGTVKAQVLDLAVKFYPKSDELKTNADAVRDQAQGFAEEKVEEPLPPENGFKPSEHLKKLFRQVAKKIHPDLASDEKECARRHKLMARLNRAYARMDEEEINAVLTEWEAGDPGSEELSIGARLAKMVRQIARVRKRLWKISSDLESLENSEMALLKKRIDAAREEGRDLLQEMADAVDEKIISLKTRIKDLAHELG